MHASASKRLSRIFTFLIPALFLAACEGDGQDRTINQPVPPEPPVPPGFCDPINFEPLCPEPGFANFAGGFMTVVDVAGLPEAIAAGNDSLGVGRMTKADPGNGEAFGGSRIFVEPFAFTAGDSFTAKIYSSRPVRVLLEPGPVGGQSQGLGVEITHGGTGWEEMTFSPLPAPSGQYDGVVLIFDNGVLGDLANNPDDWTFFVDDITVVGGGGGPGPGPGSAPDTSAPTPTQDAANVISLYSDAYTDVATTWPTPWSEPNNTTSDVTIDGGLVKEHLTINFVGVEFQVDATSMTHLHVDIWTPDADSLLLRVVDFGGDGFGGGNDTSGEVTLDNASTPALVQGSWVSVDIPLADLQAAGLASLADLNQIVFDPTADGSTVYVDNLYFYNDVGGGGTAPTVSAPTPTQDAANVISLYSDAYTDVATTWPTPWSEPNDTTSDVTIDGGLVKEHLAINFVGVEFTVDATSMTHIHFDVWTPDADSLLFRLVDFGGDGFGGGNDTSGEVTLDNASTPALAQGAWVSVDIQLSDLQAAGLASLADLNQIVIDPTDDGSTVYIDNLYFYNDAGGGGTAPTVSAPTPTQDAANVISLYSDAYTDVATTWPTPWSEPNDTTSDVTIDGGLVKEHLAINFVGVEFTVDATSMTHIHLDVWTPDADSLLVRLVDFGGDGFGGANPDTSGDVTLDNASTPALTQGSWVSVDIPLADFQAAGLASLADLNQIVLDPTDDGSTVYIDNVYFYNDNAGGGTAPTVSAPTPTQDAANVISLYSDAYTDIAVTWPTPWSEPNDTTSDVTIDGGLVKEHLAINFVGVEFQVDGTSMTHLHLDVWTPDADSLLVRLVDFGGDGFGGANPDTSGDVTLDNASTPALAQGSWVSVDIPLADFQAAGLASLADLNQIVLDPTDDGSTVYVDNVYFYNDVGGGSASLVNGDFEDNGGSLDGWTVGLFDNGGDGTGPLGVGSITADSSGQGGRAGTVARLNVAGSAASFNDAVISQEGLEQGTVMAGDTVTVTFDLYGTVTQPGAATFVEVIFLDANGQDVGGRDFLNSDPAPYTATTTWTSYSGTVTAGTSFGGGSFDVSGGLVLSMKVSCGPVDGCAQDVSFDNVTFTVN